MQRNHKKAVDISLSALFTALLAVISQISVLTPTGIPFTLQPFAIAFCGYLIGAKCGITSVAAYIFLGSIGVPVFSGFKGGIDRLFSITGGFIFGFLVLVFFCGLATRLTKGYIKIIFGVAGVLFCHLIGVIQLALLSNTSIFSSFLTASLPFIFKDIILVIAGYAAAKQLNRILKL